jgi:predicted amidohydrolase
MSTTYKIAAAQIDIALGEKEHNLNRIEEILREAAWQGARLCVFPECALTGYCFDSLEEALPHAEPVPGPSTQRLSDVCRQVRCSAVVGMLERHDDAVFNTAVLVGAEGVVGRYRKVHLPYLGVDRFTTAGQGFDVLALDGLRIGMCICYDAAFPEAARVMALDGADLIVLPTNWPPGAQCTAEYVINTRALENHVYVAAVNRVGQERGFRFIGTSRICDPSGRTLAGASADREEILYAEIDPQLARRKHIVRVPGLHEIDRFADRRPETYGRLLQPVEKAPRWPTSGST